MSIGVRISRSVNAAYIHNTMNHWKIQGSIDWKELSGKYSQAFKSHLSKLWRVKANKKILQRIRLYKVGPVYMPIAHSIDRLEMITHKWIIQNLHHAILRGCGWSSGIYGWVLVIWTSVAFCCLINTTRTKLVSFSRKKERKTFSDILDVSVGQYEG